MGSKVEGLKRERGRRPGGWGDGDNGNDGRNGKNGQRTANGGLGVGGAHRDAASGIAKWAKIAILQVVYFQCLAKHLKPNQT